MNEKRLRSRIKFLIIFFMIATMLSGITAFPLVTEMSWLNDHRDIFPSFMQEWIMTVYTGVNATSEIFPFILYGTDWLAFAHIIIALAFIGPLRDPVRNKWIIDWGILSCILTFPLAFIAGPIRNIPLFHLLIDCTFGLIGLIPLLIVRKDIKRLEAIPNTNIT